jgi:stress-induced morphogen
MAQITDASLRETITERLKATHVEVTDMSGTPTHPPHHRHRPPSRAPALLPLRSPSLTADIILTRKTGGCGQAFTSLIVSPQFQGLNSLKRHRLVNAALKEEIASIHAWTAKCKTPEEYERDRETDTPPLDGTVGGHVEGTTA